LRDAEQHLLDQGEGSALDVIQVFDPNNGLVTQVRASNDGNDDGSVTSLNFSYDKFGNLQERSDAACRVRQRQWSIVDIGVAVVALSVIGVGDDGVGAEEAAQGGVVEPGVEVDQAEARDLFLSGEACQ